MTLKRILLVLVAAAMMADLATFVPLVHVVGIDNEMNPLMVAAYHFLGLAAIAWLKVGLTVVLLLLVSRLDRRWMLVSGAGVAIFLGLLGAYGNVTALLR